jgi:hypothetical protein
VRKERLPCDDVDSGEIFLLRISAKDSLVMRNASLAMLLAYCRCSRASGASKWPPPLLLLMDPSKGRIM